MSEPLWQWPAYRGEAIPGSRRLIFQAFNRGRRAAWAWLPGADWEALLQRPLDEIRLELGLQNLPVYEEVRSEASEQALKSRPGQQKLD